MTDDRRFGILFTERGRLPFYNKLTKMEYSHFTKPEEVRNRLNGLRDYGERS